MATSIQKYLDLRKEIDSTTQKLWESHGSNMACKKGCDLCCLNFDVFPIEFDAIKKQIKEEYPEVLNKTERAVEKGACIYLKDHQCSIYNARPIICRTHGFPLLNMNEEGDQWELSHCELNFNDVDEDYFDEENTFKQDTFNSKLYMLNKAYLKENNNTKYRETDLIPLRQILDK